MLAAFLVVRGFVPPGYMPSDGSSGSFYMLCHGDFHSAQILALDPASVSSTDTSQTHAEHSLCPFSAVSVSTTNSNVSMVFDRIPYEVRRFSITYVKQLQYFIYPARAPPHHYC